MQASRAAAASAASTSGRSSLVATPLRRNSARRGRIATAAFSGGEMDTISTISQLATTSALAVGAFMLLNQPTRLPEQDRLDHNSEPCPVCHGSGYEECLCSRWSDGDAGCGSCSKTGYMRCRGCGGGGKAVPLMVRVPRK
ncbi:hypothetical protein HYH03_017277 [Edaphochlamys debaryana]|uniref:Uncharacterized protein n=1 Tax=Edaphochlamys debaryana TaxID=47281 RepID=A0A836BQR8_9CHLO|nr:hypothetical protein HYH03_017277 [Edaphochlamys debaryana]|eukprot:KAG2483883.1 hypothetical protein HYH03_017277 [Edaphochlamys debaryana]